MDIIWIVLLVAYVVGVTAVALAIDKDDDLKGKGYVIYALLWPLLILILLPFLPYTIVKDIRRK